MAPGKKINTAMIFYLAAALFLTIMSSTTPICQAQDSLISGMCTTFIVRWGAVFFVYLY